MPGSRGPTPYLGRELALLIGMALGICLGLELWERLDRIENNLGALAAVMALSQRDAARAPADAEQAGA